MQVIGKMCIRIAFFNRDASLRAYSRQNTLNLGRFSQQIVIGIPQTLADRIGHVLGFPQRVNHGHHQRTAVANSSRGDIRHLDIAVPADEFHLSLYLRCFHNAKDIEHIAYRFPAHFVVADLIVVDGIMDRFGGSRGVPRGLLRNLGSIVHRAIGIVGLEVSRYTVGAVGHPNPVLADGTDYVNIGQLGVVAHPVLSHTGARHTKVNKGFMICIRIGDGIRAIAVTGCGTAYAHGDNAAKLKGLICGIRIGVVIKGKLTLKALVHGQIPAYVPLCRLCSVGATLTPEIAHMGQGIVPRRDLSLQCLLASRKECLTLLIFGRAGLPDTD